MLRELCFNESVDNWWGACATSLATSPCTPPRTPSTARGHGARPSGALPPPAVSVSTLLHVRITATGLELAPPMQLRRGVWRPWVTENTSPVHTRFRSLLPEQRSRSIPTPTHKRQHASHTSCSRSSPLAEQLLELRRLRQVGGRLAVPVGGGLAAAGFEAWAAGSEIEQQRLPDTWELDKHCSMLRGSRLKGQCV